jgi:undecaprenyl-diphosphatase
MDKLISLDVAIFRFINGISNPILDFIMYFISLLGHLGAIMWVICIVVIIKDRKRGKIAALLCVVSIIISDQVLGHALKALWPRQRPYLYLEGVRVLGHRFHDGAFPSGHADALFAGTVILSHFYPPMATPLYLFCLLTCLSRVYCGMHHPLDVIAGALLGFLTGHAVLLIYRRAALRKEGSQ